MFVWNRIFLLLHFICNTDGNYLRVNSHSTSFYTRVVTGERHTRAQRYFSEIQIAPIHLRRGGLTVFPTSPSMFPPCRLIWLRLFLDTGDWIASFIVSQEKKYSCDPEKSRITKVLSSCPEFSDRPQNYFQQLTMRRKFSCSWKPWAVCLVATSAWQSVNRYGCKDWRYQLWESLRL